jgi:hypothetical protein
MSDFTRILCDHEAHFKNIAHQENTLWVCISHTEATHEREKRREHYAAMANHNANMYQGGPGTYIPNLQDIIIDTAASAHMMTELNLFFDIENTDSTVRLADGSTIKVTLKGTVRVSALDTNGSLKFLDLFNCLYVPSLSHSLFSIP